MVIDTLGSIDMTKLLYIGKSNKKFTHGKIYKTVYYGYSYFPIIINSNKGLVTLKEEHSVYFEDNFKIIDKKEEDKIIRKNKLKKLDN